jgi:hypothetical protein
VKMMGPVAGRPDIVKMPGRGWVRLRPEFLKLEVLATLPIEVRMEAKDALLADLSDPVMASMRDMVRERLLKVEQAIVRDYPDRLVGKLYPV